LSQPKSTEEREESRIGLLTIYAGGIGFAAGFIAFILYHLIGLLTNLFFYGRLDFSFVSPENNQLGLFVILVPAFGGLVAGLMIKYGSTRIIGHGIPEAMESVLLNRSKIEPKVGILKAASAAVTIGTGQPFGAEGPIIQTGGAFGSFIGQIVSMTGAERKILLASGAAAGMAAVFGTPISAVLLVIELLLFEFRVKSLVPVGVASAIGAWMHIYLISSAPLFQTVAFNFGGLSTLPFYIILGLLSGLLGTVLSKGLYKSEDLFRKMKIPQPWLPAVGGLAVGIIGFAVPQILGVGYNVITGVMNGTYAISIVVMIMLAKAVAWVLAMGSETSGGTLAPLFLIGSSTGFVYGTIVLRAVPSLGVLPGVFGVAAMAAVFGTASRAPFASIVFAIEATGDYQGVLPIILTVVIAELVGEYLMEESIMTEKLARRGMRVRHIYDYNPLRQMGISKVMTQPVSSVTSDESVVDLYRRISSADSDLGKRNRLVVVDRGKAVGVVDRRMLFEAASHADPTLTVEAVCDRDILNIKEDELAYEAFRQMSMHNKKFVIVVDKNGSPKGFVSSGDLIRAFKGKFEDETFVENPSWLTRIRSRRRQPAEEKS
jgi:chloride channel protein, CIC family